MGYLCTLGTIINVYSTTTWKLTIFHKKNLVKWSQQEQFLWFLKWEGKRDRDKSVDTIINGGTGNLRALPKPPFLLPTTRYVLLWASKPPIMTSLVSWPGDLFQTWSFKWRQPPPKNCWDFDPSLLENWMKMIWWLFILGSTTLLCCMYPHSFFNV